VRSIKLAISSAFERTLIYRILSYRIIWHHHTISHWLIQKQSVWLIIVATIEPSKDAGHVGGLQSTRQPDWHQRHSGAVDIASVSWISSRSRSRRWQPTFTVGARHGTMSILLLSLPGANPYKIFVITRRMNVRRHCLLNVLPAGLWNSLPPSIVNISSLLLFKKTINNVHVNLFTRYWSLICLCSLQLCVVIVSFLPIAICITRLCDMLVALYR